MYARVFAGGLRLSEHLVSAEPQLLVPLPLALPAMSVGPFEPIADRILVVHTSFIAGIAPAEF